MKHPLKILLSFLFLSPFAFYLSPSSSAQPVTTIKLWPSSVPSESRPKSPDVLSTDHGGSVTRIAAVTDPVLEVFEPYGGNSTGVGVVVCPGGGYSILAIDLEGYEVASWLNSLGITAFVLHYRVPGNPAGALMDAQRALRVVRNEYCNRAPYLKKIGIMGFSAGGSLSARASTRYRDKTYEPIDEADNFSARPDFTLLIYPAYLDQGPDRSLTPELKVDAVTPPMFLFETADDPYGNSALVMAGALRDAKVPVELHFLPKGGHGYGVRPGNPAAETWPDLAAKWLKQFITLPDPAKPFNNSDFMDIGGMKLHYRIWPGSGSNDSLPRVLMVHGMGGSTWSWEENAPVLAAAGYTVVAVDVPPFGYSDKNPNFDQSVTSRAELLWKLINHLNPDVRWILTGHSMGGGIVQAMSILQPDKVDKVIFVDPALFSTREEKGPVKLSLLKFRPFEWIASGVGKAVLIRPKKIRDLLLSAYSAEPDSADVAEYYRALSQPGTARALIRSSTAAPSAATLDGKSFNKPALAIWGETDTWVPLQRMQPLLKQLPTIKVSVIPGAGHCPMETHPAKFNRLILEYLEK